MTPNAEIVLMREYHLGAVALTGLVAGGIWDGQTLDGTARRDRREEAGYEHPIHCRGSFWVNQSS